MPPGDAQRLFDTLFGLDAPIGFAVLDSSHRFLAVNEVLARHHHRSVAEHLGRRIEELAVDVSSGARAGQVIDRVVDTGEAVQPGRGTRAAGGRDRSAAIVLESGPRRQWRDDRSRSVRCRRLRAAGSRTGAARQPSAHGQLLEVAEELAQAVTVSEVVAAVTAIGRRTMGADWSYVALLGPDGLALVPGENEPNWVTETARNTRARTRRPQRVRFAGASSRRGLVRRIHLAGWLGVSRRRRRDGTWSAGCRRHGPTALGTPAGRCRPTDRSAGTTVQPGVFSSAGARSSSASPTVWWKRVIVPWKRARRCWSGAWKASGIVRST